jgi:hypothetical protein
MEAGELEAPGNPAYQQYLAERAEQERTQQGPVLASMAAHCVLPAQQQLYHQLGMVQQCGTRQQRQLGSQQLAQQLGGAALAHRSPLAAAVT